MSGIVTNLRTGISYGGVVKINRMCLFRNQVRKWENFPNDQYHKYYLDPF